MRVMHILNSNMTILLYTPLHSGIIRIMQEAAKNYNEIIIEILYVYVMNFTILKTWRVIPKGIYSSVCLFNL